MSSGGGQEYARKRIKLSLGDKFSHIKQTGCSKLCCKCNKPQRSYLNKTELLYLKGYDLARKELDITGLLKTIHQLKAAISAIISNDQSLISKCKQIYLNNTTIYEDSDDEVRYKLDDKFNDFLMMDSEDMVLVENQS